MHTPPRCAATKMKEKEINGQGKNVNAKESSKASMLGKERKKDKEKERKKERRKKKLAKERETSLVEGREHAHLQDMLQ